MQYITERVIWWLLDGRDYKKTFFLFTYDMDHDEKIAAKTAFDTLDQLGLITRIYQVENSFVAYSKLSYATLREPFSKVVDKQK